MKKFIIGIVMLTLDFIIVVIGVAFNIVVPLLEEWSIVTEIMWIIGFIGIGTLIGTLLSLFGLWFIGDWITDK